MAKIAIKRPTTRVAVKGPGIVKGIRITTGPPGAPGPAGGVDSVNGKQGTVTLTASDVGAATTAQGTKADGAAQKSANLSDLANAGTARSNLGLGTAAQASSGDFASSAKGAAEKSAALSATTGTATGDLSAASIFTVTPTGAITLAFTNVPASGTACTVTVLVTQGATVRTVAPPSGTKWMGAAAPTQAANKACAFTFVTVNGGTTWYASAAVEQ